MNCPNCNDSAYDGQQCNVCGVSPLVGPTPEAEKQTAMPFDKRRKMWPDVVELTPELMKKLGISSYGEKRIMGFCPNCECSTLRISGGSERCDKCHWTPDWWKGQKPKYYRIYRPLWPHGDPAEEEETGQEEAGLNQAQTTSNGGQVDVLPRDFLRRQ